MKKILVVIIVALIGFIGWDYYNSSNSSSNNLNMKTIVVPVTNQGPFKYFQLNIGAVEGVSGKILLNDEEVKSFDGRGSQGSYNQAQELIKDGANKLELLINSVDPNAKPSLLSDGGLIKITLNALDTQSFPSKENERLRINWNPSDGNNVIYTFSIKRDSTVPQDAFEPDYNVSEAEKTLAMETLEQRQNLFATKDVTLIRTYYLKTLPVDIGVTKMPDTQILSMAKMELDSLVEKIPLLKNADTKWAKVRDTIQALVKIDGQYRLESVKKIDGVWY